MSLLATTTLAALLIANPASNDVDRIAANGGFLLGNAHRCGIDNSRIVKAGHLVEDLIKAASTDSQQAEDATLRYATFFVVSAYPDREKEKVLASCKMVESEFRALESHKFPSTSPADDTNAPATVASANETRHFRVSDGE
jgi:hypothetical protein